jgi:DNA polymerase I
MRQLATNGCLFDLYHLKDRIVLWFKDTNDIAKRLEYRWSPSIYVASNSKSALKSLTKSNLVLPFVKEHKFENKLENPSGSNMQEVLRIYVNDSSKIMSLARNIERLSNGFDYYRIYNADISAEQSFLYEKNVHPLGFYIVESNSSSIEEEDKDDNNSRVGLILADSNESIAFDYALPNFKFLSFDLILEKKTSKITTSFNDKILAISVKVFDNENNNVRESFLVSEDTEMETILVFSYEVNRLDPDIILTSGGDRFLFPCLLQRAKANDIAPQLLINLNRESDPEFLQKKNRMRLQKINPRGNSDELASSSYTSYGKVYFKPRPFLLYGRIHIDTETSFIYKETGLDGLSEISRVCMIPPQAASRATIGKCLSSLYFYNAQKKGILVPWKPSTSEIFKTFGDLLKADKGGFVFESKAGAYDNVAEFDFVSLYPNIMLKENISSETINCDCCNGFYIDNRVPGLDHLYHICKKRTGLVPLSLKTVLDRRLEYKKRKNKCTSSSIDKNLKHCYDRRQAALKWILVTSFGYLGFSNSKFGRIDAHIAVCAFARDILLKVSKIAEGSGFEVIHGIVDSIWVRIGNNGNNGDNDMERYKESCESLRKRIEAQTGFSISFEGIYKWIVFDSSKTNPRLPALNRYFGVFEDGTIKARGIETRRHDTPPLFERFQNELLDILSAANNLEEANELLQKLGEEIYNKYKKLILSEKVHYSDLVFAKRISKNSDEYSNRNTLENCAIQLLAKNGKLLHAGEEIKYVISDFYNKGHRRRSLPVELIDSSSFSSNSDYDKRRYCELLEDAYESITSHFY